MKKAEIGSILDISISISTHLPQDVFNPFSVSVLFRSREPIMKKNIVITVPAGM